MRPFQAQKVLLRKKLRCLLEILFIESSPQVEQTRRKLLIGPQPRTIQVFVHWEQRRNKHWTLKVQEVFYFIEDVVKGIFSTSCYKSTTPNNEMISGKEIRKDAEERGRIL
jgi:hypothetical protein